MNKSTVFVMIIIAGVILLQNGCSEKSNLRRYAQKIHVKGRVFDQYGQPADHARVYFDYLYHGPGKASHTEGEDAYTDEEGRFDFNPTDRYHWSYDVVTGESINREGMYYSTSSEAIYGYKKEIGWIPNLYYTYDPDKGWETYTNYGYDNKHTIPRIPVPEPLFRANRSDPPEPMIDFWVKDITGEESGHAVGINVATGKAMPLPCEECDFALQFTQCPPVPGKTHAGAGLLEVTPMKGGGLIPYNGRKMATIEAPPGDYHTTLRIIPPDCTMTPKNPDTEIMGIPSETTGFFFRSRGDKMYGFVDLRRDSFKYVEYSNNLINGIYIPVYDWIFDGTWAKEINIIANPRGNRNLNRQGALELPVTQIPYQDDWMLDFTKFEVIEDPAKGTVAIKGLPGAAHTVTGYHITRFWIGSEGGKDARSFNPDGSFAREAKGHLDDLFKVSYQTDKPYEPYVHPVKSTGGEMLLIKFKQLVDAAKSAKSATMSSSASPQAAR